MEEWVHVQMGGAPRAHDAVQRWVQGVQQEIAGRVVLRGCPWEEGGRRRRGAAQMMWGLKRPPARRPELDHATKSRNAAQAREAEEGASGVLQIPNWKRGRGFGVGRRTSFPEMAIMTASHFTGKRGKTDAY